MFKNKHSCLLIPQNLDVRKQLKFLALKFSVLYIIKFDNATSFKKKFLNKS